MRVGAVRMVLIGVGIVVIAATGTVVLTTSGQAAGQASCYPVSPATAAPQDCITMTDPDAAGLAIWGVRGSCRGHPRDRCPHDARQPDRDQGQAVRSRSWSAQHLRLPADQRVHADACLQDNGTVTVGGQALSASDIAWLQAARATAGQRVLVHPWLYGSCDHGRTRKTGIGITVGVCLPGMTPPCRARRWLTG